MKLGQNYITNEEILQNVLIYEYDINKAGLSLLKEYSDLSKETLKSLDSMNKIDRNVAIGKLMQSDSKYKKFIEGNIKETIKEFLDVNEISMTNIISIKRDAVFTTKKCDTLKLNKNISFKLVDIYSSYYRFEQLSKIQVEFYYSTSEKDFVIKGLGKNYKENNNLFLEELIKLIKILEKLDKNNRCRILIDFRKKYCEKLFPKEMYRELNTENKFRICYKDHQFLCNSFDDLSLINGMYNYTFFIVPIIKNFT